MTHSPGRTVAPTIIVRRPASRLAKFVDLLWYYDSPDESSGADRLLPHGEFELVIGIGARASTSDGDTLVSGPHSRAIIVDPSGQSPMVGAHFKPGGAAALLGYPAHEFRNLDVPLRDIWSVAGGELQARLIDVGSPHEALEVLERSLCRSPETAPIQHPAVSLAISEFHSPEPRKRIRDLVAESGLSQRRFIELFNSEIGLTPKLYARIRRFQRALRQMNDRRDVDWADLAYACGYADQAHFVREFRDFSGLRPSEYLPRWPDHPNHVPYGE